MNKPEEYDPIAERVQPDLLHDLFVPKYSALASAQPSRLVLAGVGLIFAPMAAGAIIATFTMMVQASDWPAALVGGIPGLAGGGLAVAILYSQTRRYLTATPLNDSEEEANPAESDS